MTDGTRVRLVQRIRSAVAEWRDVRNLIGWGLLASGLIAVLMVVTMLAASLLLLLLWYVLRWIAAPLRLLRRAIS